MGIASIDTRQIAIGAQSALGTLALVGSGQLYNHLPGSTSDLVKTAFDSETVRTDHMYLNPRHGLRSGEFVLEQELQIGGHTALFAAALQGALGTAPTTGALTNVTAAASGVNYTRAAGSFITDGFKVGDVVRWTGWATTGTPNNSRNFWITALTATQMTGIHLDGTAVGAKASGDSVTCTGYKRLQIPTSSHTKTYFTIDDWHSDVPANMRIKDAIVTSLSVDIQPNGMATVTLNFLGTDGTPGTAQYFSSPAAAATGAILAGPNGKLNYNGTVSTVMTGLQFTMDNGAEVKPVIGSNLSPDVFRDGLRITGSLSALFDGNTLHTPFDAETEAPLYVVLTADSTATSEFMVFKLPNVKLNGSDKTQDGPAYTVSADFSAGRYVAGSTVIEGTALVIIDSTL